MALHWLTGSLDHWLLTTTGFPADWISGPLHFCHCISGLLDSGSLEFWISGFLVLVLLFCISCVFNPWLCYYLELYIIFHWIRNYCDCSCILETYDFYTTLVPLLSWINPIELWSHSGSENPIWLSFHCSTTGASTISPLRHPNDCSNARKSSDKNLKADRQKLVRTKLFWNLFTKNF